MTTDASNTEAGPAGLASRIITGWALAGGVVLMMVVFMNTWSVIGANFGMPFSGNFCGSEVSKLKMSNIKMTTAKPSAPRQNRPSALRQR